MGSDREFDLGPEDMATMLLLFPYYYGVVDHFAKIDGLKREELAQSPGKNAALLSMLFNKHSIDEVSLSFLPRAQEIATEWLMSDTVDEQEALAVIKEADDALTKLSPVIREIYEMEEVGSDFAGGPLVLAAIGNAIQLVEGTLKFHKSDIVNLDQIKSIVLDQILSEEDTGPSAGKNSRKPGGPA